jgi:hypothetical protein
MKSNGPAIGAAALGLVAGLLAAAVHYPLLVMLIAWPVMRLLASERQRELLQQMPEKVLAIVVLGSVQAGVSAVLWNRVTGGAGSPPGPEMLNGLLLLPVPLIWAAAIAHTLAPLTGHQKTQSGDDGALEALVAEATLGAVVVLTWAVARPSGPIIGLALGLMTAGVAVFATQDPGRSTLARLAVVVTAAALELGRVQAAVRAAHDAAITEHLVRWSVPLVLALVLAGALVVCGTAFVVGVVNPTWRLPAFNRRALPLLAVLSDSEEPRWEEHLRLRHRWHPAAVHRWFGRPLDIAVGTFTAVFGWPLAILGEQPPMGRLAILLGEQLQAASHEADLAIYELRRARFARDERATRTAEPRVTEALRARGRRLVRLVDHQVCPFEGCPTRTEVPIEIVEALALELATELGRLRLYLDDAAASEGQALQQRLARCQPLLDQSPVNTVLELGRPFREGTRAGDAGRLALRDQVLAWLDDEPRPELIDHAVDGLIAELWAARDGAGVIEAVRKLAPVGVTLSPRAHLDAGESVLTYAEEVAPAGQGAIATWLADRALGHLLEAQARGHVAAVAEAQRTSNQGEAARVA